MSTTWTSHSYCRRLKAHQPAQLACNHNTLSSVLLSDLHRIMADIIRYISSFSDDAVHNVIQQAVGAEKQCFNDMLVKIQSQLEKTPKRKKKESRMFRQTDKTIFEQKVLAQICEKPAEYDRLETSSKQLEWKVRLDFVRDYQSLNISKHG